MHTICETRAFQKQAADSGMTSEDIEALASYLAANPDAGDEIKGTGGCRKIRRPLAGQGKRGGCRVITFFTGPDLPVFLLAAFAKNERVDLTQSERNKLVAFTKDIVLSYRQRVVRVEGER